MMRALDGQLLAGADYGNKALGLCRLISKGFAVPPAFAITADDPIDQETIWGAVHRWAGDAISSSGHVSLAIRSSSPAEDGTTESGAGQFDSVLGEYHVGDSGLLRAIEKVRASGHLEPLPVIVQMAISPQVAGVAFSCDPVSFDRDPYLVSWVLGSGNELVAGQHDGSLLVASSADSYDGQWHHDPSTLHELFSALDVLESEIQRPVDVEWALDSEGKLWLLQVRPVVLPEDQCADGCSLAELKSLPGVIAGHSKMRLRLAAARAGVKMSNAAVLTTRNGSLERLPDWIPGQEASGLSIVLLHPSRTNNKVQREYAQVNDTNVPFFTHGCRRYSIRRFPPHESALAVANDVLSRGLAQSWVASAVIQEIYDAAATGIVRRLGNDYVAELAVGHFVPKGVVDPSRFIVSQSGQVLERFPAAQEVAYRFINGYVVTERPVEEQLQLSDDQIASAVHQVAPLFDEYPDAALEFGIITDRDDAIHAYVIDLAEGDSESTAGRLSLDLIRDGVLSPGRAVGEAVRVLNNGHAELDAHLFEEFAEPGARIEDAVFVADRASVDLLPLVARCGHNTGFVFRHASLLAHLCVVLRERGIPAVCVQDDDLFGKLTSGLKLTVEAANADWISPRVS